MNTDIRLSIGFWQHPKTKKTVKRLGLEGVRSLQILWLWAAVNRPDGSLVGMDWEDIELAADWQGEDRAFLECCLGMWIEETESGYALHDWTEHNPWQAEAEARSEKARKAAIAKWSNAQAMRMHSMSNAPLLSSPLLSSPFPEEKDIKAPPYPPVGGEGKNTVSLFSLAGEPPVDTEAGKSKPEGEDARTLPHGDANEKPAAGPKKKKKPKGLDLPPPSEFFNRCWEKYPRKVSKGKAWRTFHELDEAGVLPDDLPDRIDCRRFEDDWNTRKDPGRMQYIPHMATWLHRQGWEDAGCMPEEDPRNLPPEIDAKYQAVRAKYNGGMPSRGETREETLEKCRRMDEEIDALDAQYAEYLR